jgi:hypothetical protein
MVTPFAWSQPHPVNDHVAGAAEHLRRRGHEVVVLAPSNRAAELAAGRRALKRLLRAGVPLDGVVAVGPAIPVSPGSRLGVPVGARANLQLALSADRFDVVHAHDPALPSLSYLALRDAHTFTVATFHSTERLAYPPGRKQRERLLARVDALTAVGADVAEAASARFPGSYETLPVGIDTELFRPGRHRRLFVLEWRAEDGDRGRAALRALRSIPGFGMTVLVRPLSPRPYIPLALRGRVRVRLVRDPAQRAHEVQGACGFLPASHGSPRLRLEAMASGVPVVDPPGADRQPELVAATLERLAVDEAHRAAASETCRRESGRQSFEVLARDLERIYTGVTGRRRAAPPVDLLGDRPWVLADLHMHTAYSHDCSVSVPELLERAEAEGLDVIAVTDHNVLSGALEAAELVRGRRLKVIPGEEVKTSQGEIIGLFLREEIPPGMTPAETVCAIHDQGGLVYLPHPFDRMHRILDAPTLHRLLAEIDIVEVYNARLLFESYNDEALRFARKYNLTMGAGSDAHVHQGVGTGAVRMRAWDTPEEFLLSLRTAEVLRRPKSLLYLQGLKWAAQARGRRKTGVA